MGKHVTLDGRSLVVMVTIQSLWTFVIIFCVRKTCHEPLLAHATMPDGNRVHLSATNEVIV